MQTCLTGRCASAVRKCRETLWRVCVTVAARLNVIYIAYQIVAFRSGKHI